VRIKKESDQLALRNIWAKEQGNDSVENDRQKSHVV
jgi:hypothetical protein